MSKAKVPDNKSDWKSIDIFLFSNGQKSSPPRKYHLVTEQLDWWKATLCFLAKSQYGSLHSMVDLYTIEGQKVETPMQLSHNTAYVAVAPPDLFINAGYGKYLIKATRSWEKGQIRRSSNTAGDSQEEVQIENNKSNSDFNRVFEPARVTRDGNVTLKPIVASMVDNQASVTVKPDATSVKHINNTINLNMVKQSDGTSRSIAKNPGIVKRNAFPSPPRSRKPSLKRKDCIKTNMETTKDRSSSELNKKSKIYKPSHKPRDSLPETVLTKVDEVLNEVKSSQSLKLINVMDTMIKASDVVNVVGDNETAMTTNYNINAYSEKPSIAVNPDMNLSDNVNRQGAAHELFDESHQFVSNDCDELEKMEGSKMAMSLISKGITDNPPLIEHELPSPMVTKVTKPENDVALINKEGTVNLKLNMEIWNYPNDTKMIPTIVSEKDSLIILKLEKGSQLDVEGKPLEHNKTIANEISYEGNHKVIIVKCACLNQDDEKAQIPINIGNSNLLVYVPVLKLNLETNTVLDETEITTIKRKSIAIKEGQEMYQLQNSTKSVNESIKEDVKVLPLELENSECVVIKNESNGILHKSASKFTQTEWCDVLLEVKLQNDEHYSFHLPTLEMINNYKL